VGSSAVEETRKVQPTEKRRREKINHVNEDDIVTVVECSARVLFKTAFIAYNYLTITAKFN
jgi:hypothetical protein